MESWREELYLMHSAKGTTWTNARYIAKEKVNGKWLYFYSMDQYNHWKQHYASKKPASASRIPEKDYKDPGNKAATRQTNTFTGKNSTKSSKSGSKSSSGSSGKKKSSGSKKSSSKAGKVSSADSKEKTAAKAKSTAEKKETNSKSTEKVKVVDRTPIGVDFIKKAFNLQDADVKTRVEKDPVKLESLLNTNNDDGSFGYLVMNMPNGTTETVRWSKYNGQVSLKKFDSDDAVTFDQLPKYMTAQEIRINKKSK